MSVPAAACEFDEAFYRANYADALAGAECYDHFVREGVHRGFMPNPRFDPVLYRMRTPAAREAHPWEHYLQNGLGARHAGGLTAEFPEIAPEFYARHQTDVAELQVSPAEARALCDAGDLSFDWQGQTYRFHHPQPSAFLDRIAADRPFAFARVPHGFWDSVVVAATTADAIGRDPRARFASGEECWSLATRLCFERFGHIGTFAPNFLREVLADLERKDVGDDLCRAVAFKGFPTAGDSVFPAEPPGPANLERFQVFASFFSAAERLYDATLWKRWAAGGALRDFPGLCREHPVILVGSERLADLPRRFGLTDFFHVQIPPANTHFLRHLVLGQCRASLAPRLGRARKPIVLFQSGGSLSSWFIHRLHREQPGAFYLDLGQTLDIWFMDRPRPVTPTWLKVYRDHIVEHCGIGA